MQPSKPLLDTPTNTTKKFVRGMYWKLSATYVRRVIQQAIAHNNKGLPANLKLPLRTKTLNEKHMKYIVDVLGTAPGYKPLEETPEDQ